LRAPVRFLSPLVLAALAVSVAAGPPRETVHVTIVHTNDLHGHVENAAAMAAVARAARAKNPNTLFLDAGDCITGTPVSSVFKGEPIVEIMTLMGYDAGTVGNHEFDHGWPQVAKLRALAGYPLLNANAFDPAGKCFGDEPYHVFTVGGVRIGVIGLLSGEMATLTTTANWAGCTVEPPLAAAKRLVPEVRAKCDVVVLLTHVGVETDAAIAGAVPGIDLVVGGHSHTELKEPLAVASGDRKVPVVQAYRYGERVGIVDFEWDAETRTVRGLKGRLVKIDPATMPNAGDVRELVDQWQKRTEDAAGVADVIGKTAEKLTKEKLRDALERIFAEVLHADFGFQNLSGVRDDIAKGDIRVGDVWNVLPFENTLVTIRLKGDQVPKDVRTRLGSAFDADREYACATNSYVSDQQKRYFGSETAPVTDSGLAMRDAVVAWVKEHGGFTADGKR
jgi:2',3'-cyclic-nucleotide 2'-phosphodiesterase (5'-nucleotidase family)